MVTVVVSSFTVHLGNWAADHADEISQLDNIDALTAYGRVGFSNEDLEVMNFYFLIKLDRFGKFLMSIRMSLTILTPIRKTTSPLRSPRTCTSEI